MENWMKEQAAQCHGGLCMSKFVWETEKKRIARLQTIRSTFPHHQKNHPNPSRNSRTNTKISNDTTENDVGRKRQVKPDFFVCPESTAFSFRDASLSEQTKTGLTLRLHPTSIQHSDIRAKTCMRKRSTSTTTTIACPTLPRPSLLRQSSNRSMISNSNQINTTSAAHKTRGKENENQYKSKSKTIQKTKAGDVSSISNPNKDDKVSITLVKTFTQTVNAGSSRRQLRRQDGNDKLIGCIGTQHISMSTLTKEREEALALLRTLGYDNQQDTAWMINSVTHVEEEEKDWASADGSSSHNRERDYTTTNSCSSYEDEKIEVITNTSS